jgi:hypothetical protein
MFLLLLGERIFGGEDPMRYGLSGAGLLLTLVALGMVLSKRKAASPEQRPAHSQAVRYGSIGIGAVFLYALTLSGVVDGLGFSDDLTESRYITVTSAIWPIVWLAGTLPFLAVSRSLSVSPLLVMPSRVKEAAGGGLSMALALAMIFPLNYLASQNNQRWDFGYFKTASPGTSTMALVDGLDTPVRAYLFFPASSDVREEVRTYFDQLQSPNLDIQYVDHALEPDLAKELKVRDNGSIVIARGEGDDLQSESIKVGAEFEKARRRLKTMDEDVRKALIKLARDKRTVYVTVGHGELYWDSDTDPLRKLNIFKRVLSAMNFRVKELGLTEGLATEVPEDADVVLVAGPTMPMLDEELASLDTFRKQGGALWILGEPDMTDLSAVLKPLGVSLTAGQTLTSDQNIVPIFRAPRDKTNIVTNKYSTHPSVTTLSRNNDELIFIALGAAPLVEEGKVSFKRTVAMRSMAEVWSDDGNYTLDASDGERRQSHNLLIAASGPASEAVEGDDGEFRVIVMGDATWATDAVLDPRRTPANVQLIADSIAWLAEDEALAGTVESEEDIKIEHSKAGQGWMFYGTAFIVPFGLLGLGLGRIRRRTKGGAA